MRWWAVAGLLVGWAGRGWAEGLLSREELREEARNRLDTVDAFFVKNVHSAQDLKAHSEKELAERLQKVAHTIACYMATDEDGVVIQTEDFLGKMEADKKYLRALANRQLALILNRVDGWKTSTARFQAASFSHLSG